MYLSLEKWEPPLLFLGTRRWKNCGYKFTIHCVCFSLRSSRTFSVLQSQGKPQIWEQSSWASLGGGEKTWKLSVSCSLKYPTAVVLWFLGARDWHQNLLHTPCNSGREMRRAGVLPLEQAQGRAAMSLQEEGFRADGPSSTSPLFVCIHLESLVAAPCEKCITDYNWTHPKKTYPTLWLQFLSLVRLFIFSFLFIAWVKLAHLKFCFRSRILCNWWYFTAESPPEGFVIPWYYHPVVSQIE